MFFSLNCCFRLCKPIRAEATEVSVSELWDRNRLPWNSQLQDQTCQQSVEKYYNPSCLLNTDSASLMLTDSDFYFSAFSYWSPSCVSRWLTFLCFLFSEMEMRPFVFHFPSGDLFCVNAVVWLPRQSLVMLFFCWLKNLIMLLLWYIPNGIS